MSPTVLLVPGMRDHVDNHWQTLLQARMPGCRSVPPMGREDLDCARRVDAIEMAAQAIHGPLLLVAHSGGGSMVAISRNDPLGHPERIRALARDWGSETADLGEAGHLNPASGFGEWPQALDFIAQLSKPTDP